MTDNHWQKRKEKKTASLPDRQDIIHADRKSAFETGKKTDRQRVSLTYMIADRQSVRLTVWIADRHTESKLDRQDSRHIDKESA